MVSLFEPEGYIVEATYDLETLTRLGQLDYQLVLSYTCLAKHRPGQNDSGPEKLTDEQIAGLVQWVRAGGALLAAHCATVIGDSGAELRRLLGGAFVSHPPPFTFTVYPAYSAHPISAGIEAFTVYDEFYIEAHEPSVDVHLLAIHEGVAYPMGWSKEEGQGRVAHIALGHFPEVWNLAPYRQLMRQAANWLLNS